MVRPTGVSSTFQFGAPLPAPRSAWKRSVPCGRRQRSSTTHGCGEDALHPEVQGDGRKETEQTGSEQESPASPVGRDEGKPVPTTPPVRSRGALWQTQVIPRL